MEHSLLILALCVFSSLRNSLQVTGLITPLSPVNDHCETPNTVLEKAQNICCSKCPPGTSKVRHCSPFGDTKCEDCRDGSYTEVWNEIEQCHSCRGICKAELGLIQLQDCTAETKRICVCNHGTYCQTGMDDSDTACNHCIPHSPCGIGQGVTMPGNYSANTVCRPCPSGTFSNVTSTTHACQIHTNCTLLGMLTTREGNATADSECMQQTEGHKNRLGTENNDPSSVSLAVPSSILFVILVILTGSCIIQGFRRQLACFKKVFKSCTNDPEIQDADYKSLEITQAELLRRSEVPLRQMFPLSESKITLDTESPQERTIDCPDAIDMSNIHPSECGNQEEAGSSGKPTPVKLEGDSVKSTGVIGPVYIYNPARVYVGVISGHRDLRRSLHSRDENATNDGTLPYPQEEQGTCEREMGEFPQQECGKDSHISESVSDHS